MKNAPIWMLIALFGFGLTAGKCADLFAEETDENDDDSSGDDDDDSTGDDDDADDDADVVPDDVDDFIDADQRAALEEVGLIIYGGDDPPDIGGSYYLDSIEITYDDSNMWLDIVDYTYEFYNQTRDGEISLNYEAPAVDDVAEGVGAFISGDGDCFSIFIDAEGTASGCDYELPGIISGCLTSDGIAKWTNGFIMGSKSGENCDALMPTDHRRIIAETDDLAEKLKTGTTRTTAKRNGAHGLLSISN